MKKMLLLLTLLFPLFSQANVIPEIGPGSKPPSFDQKTWEGRLKHVESTYESIEKFYKTAFEDLTKSNKKCLKAKVAHFQATVYRDAISKLASQAVKDRAQANVDYYRAIQDNWCGGKDNPGLKLWDRYVQDVGKSRAVQDVSQGRGIDLDERPVQMKGVPTKTWRELLEDPRAKDLITAFLVMSAAESLNPTPVPVFVLP